MKRGYLPVFTYDSTGMLELASEGNIFFAFLPEGTGHLKRKFSSIYTRLRKANLMAETADGATEKISNLIDNPNAESVLLGIRGFADGIAFRNPRLITDLAHCLVSDPPGRPDKNRA